MKNIYLNNFQPALTRLFLDSLAYLRILAFFFIFFIIIFSGLYFTGVEFGKLEVWVYSCFGPLFFISITSIPTLMFKILPSEKSITINKKSLTINYPYLKKSRVISYSDLIAIRANFLNPANESEIYFKSVEANKMLNEEFIRTRSISPLEWKEIAISNNIPLILSYEIDEKVIEKQGLLRSKFVGDDNFVIQKNFDDNSIKITEQEFLDYIANEDSIRHLGKEELINIPATLQVLPRINFSLNTVYGQKPLSFFDGKIIAFYEKDKNPTEIENIASALNAKYINVKYM